MRLTLRTLLAYLDDTLEPGEIKDIGQKVAESDAAQELIARIKQVTRRRRLTTPRRTGPDAKFDPNTIAEYLDNELDADECRRDRKDLSGVRRPPRRDGFLPPDSHAGARRAGPGAADGPASACTAWSRAARPSPSARRAAATGPRDRRRRRRRSAAAGSGVVARLAPLGLAPGRRARPRRPRRRHLAGAAALRSPAVSAQPAASPIPTRRRPGSCRCTAPPKDNITDRRPSIRADEPAADEPCRR